MSLVFQFGSNASEERLNGKKRLNGAAQKKGIAKTVENFDLDFTLWSQGNNCAAADLLENGSRQIWGVLYEIPLERIFTDLNKTRNKTLQGIEGGNYRWVEVELVSADEGEILGKAVTFVGRPEKRDLEGIKTNNEYVDHILKGLKKADVPKKYIDYVKAQVKNNNSEISV